jgi:hypothetical protein
MKEQHPRKWAEYEELLNKYAPRAGGALASEEEQERLKLFFRATHIPAYSCIFFFFYSCFFSCFKAYISAIQLKSGQIYSRFSDGAHGG